MPVTSFKNDQCYGMIYIWQLAGMEMPSVYLPMLRGGETEGLPSCSQLSSH